MVGLTRSLSHLEYAAISLHRLLSVSIHVMNKYCKRIKFFTVSFNLKLKFVSCFAEGVVCVLQVAHDDSMFMSVNLSMCMYSYC